MEKDLQCEVAIFSKKKACADSQSEELPNVHFPVLHDLVANFKAVTKGDKDGMSASQTKALRYTLNGFRESQRQSSFVTDYLKRFNLHSWYDDNEKVRVFLRNPSIYVDKSSISSWPLDDGFELKVLVGVTEHAHYIKAIVAFYKPFIFNNTDALLQRVLEEENVTIVLYHQGTLVAAISFCLLLSVNSCLFADVHLIACADECSKFIVTKMEWPSNLLLSALVGTCKGVKLILAQSVGYKYTMTQGVITVSGDDSKGRKYWSKRLLFGNVALYVSSQISATDDKDIQGDCQYGYLLVD